jgi:superfamily II DNA or RNA helicase
VSAPSLNPADASGLSEPITRLSLEDHLGGRVKLTDITAGTLLDGVLPGQSVTEPFGAAVNLTYRASDGATGTALLYPKDEDRLNMAAAGGKQFDGDPALYRLALEARRIKMAGLFDPMLAVNTSDVQPLPHQIRAVYGKMLARTPLRFLLADDPGAGKTIMAGLYIKELLLRGDVQRCLIVAPGGLVEQWQDEMLLKFGMRFEILTNEMLGTPDADFFEHHPMLIARMDHVARNDLLIEQLRATEWDLAIVDEAHRMSASYFGNELKLTRRFQLGQVLGDTARHLLLMTATPHNGKEEDFQQFLTLLDRDGFEGKHRKGQPAASIDSVGSRTIKEEMLTFEGTPLFPARIAETMPYDLSPLESKLYEAVTEYVREEMNRADRLDGKRKNTVGFALTVLQRRLASSPEAIYRSLERRIKRLEQRLVDLDKPVPARLEAELDEDAAALADDEELDAAEIEKFEEEVVDAASASQTREEIQYEIKVLKDLLVLAGQVRAAGEDRKWVELRKILDDQTLASASDGRRHKLIIFTEHRDTLDYLERQVRNHLGRYEAVVSIHGGVPRPARRQVTAEFTGNPDVQILIATDAAGEGLNLQVAHLMVNYDLPWNPNRIDQRFGRVHRIGQLDECYLWNLVAINTREGQVYERLLAKLDEQHKAYGGKVFEVLGQGFREMSLRDLLIEAIRRGDDPEVRAHMERVIDASAGENVKHLIEGEALAHESLGPVELERLKRDMEEARSRRLQPFFIERFFLDAFKRLGGRIGPREPRRFEISNVPVRLRSGPQSAVRPISTKYARVTFETAHVPGPQRADLLAPGHPLFDAVVDATIADLTPVLEQGATFVDPGVTTPQVLVALLEQINDGTGAEVAQEFGFSYVDAAGTGTDAGPSPHLDLVALGDDARRTAAVTQPWVQAADKAAITWAVSHGIPALLDKTETRIHVEIDKTSERVKQRLTTESNRLYTESLKVSQAEADGKNTKQSADMMVRKAQELEQRRDQRLAQLAARRQLSPAMPRVLTTALVLPLEPAHDSAPTTPPSVDPFARKEVERRAVDAVLAAERALGRDPEEMPVNNKGYDIRSIVGGATTYIEVKGRIAGADGVTVSASEVLHGKNNPGQHILAIVAVSPDGPEHDEVRYLRDEFLGVELAGMESVSVYLDWPKTWTKGQKPS